MLLIVGRQGYNPIFAVPLQEAVGNTLFATLVKRGDNSESDVLSSFKVSFVLMIYCSTKRISTAMSRCYLPTGPLSTVSTVVLFRLFQVASLSSKRGDSDSFGVPEMPGGMVP